MAWIRIRNFCLDPDPELGKFKAGSGSGINHSGSTTLLATPHVNMTKYFCATVPLILEINYLNRSPDLWFRVTKIRNL